METHEDIEEDEEQLPRRRTGKIGLKKALAKEKEQEIALVEQLTPSELIVMDINYDREPWLERENVHLEGQLEKTKRDLDLQKKMERYYALRNKIARAKLKRSLAKIQALKEAKDKEKLEIISYSSLQSSQT